MDTEKGLYLTEQFPFADFPMFDKAISIRPGTQTHFWGEDTSKIQALFHHLIGESKCEAGTKWLDGLDVSLMTCRELGERGLAAGSARSRVFQSLTIEEHFRIRTTAVRSELSTKHWLEKAKEWFPVLRSVPRTVCGNFSGGEQQTLMLALATIGSPRIVIIEEPFTGLSVEARRDVESVFEALTKQGTMILSLSQDSSTFENKSIVIQLDH